VVAIFHHFQLKIVGLGIGWSIVGGDVEIGVPIVVRGSRIIGSCIEVVFQTNLMSESFEIEMKSASLLYEAILSLFHHFSYGRKFRINNIFVFVSYTGAIRGILCCAK